MKTLFKYQQDDANFLSKFSACANFSEPRTGKSLVALEVYHQWNQKQIAPLLIICPASLVGHWKNEITSQFPHMEILNKKDFSKIALPTITSNNAIVVSYDFVREHLPRLKFAKYHLIMDEAHAIKSTTALVSKTILSKDFDKLIHNKIVLTATPILNAPIEIFNILKFLFPTEHTNRYKFGDFWCYSKINPFVRVKYAAKEFTAIKTAKKSQFVLMLKKFSVQRRRIDVEQFMPKILSENVFIEPSDQCIKFDEKLRRTFGDITFPNGVVESIFKKQHQPAQAFLIWRKLYEWGDAYYKVKNAKTQWLIDFIEQGLNGDKVLIYSESKAYVKVLEEELSELFPNLNIKSLSGDNTDKEAESLKYDFQLGRIDVMCVSRAKCYQGVDLSKANVMILADLPPNPAILEQTINRITPPISASEAAKKTNKFIYYMYNDNAIGRWMEDLVSNKHDLVGFVNDWSWMNL